MKNILLEKYVKKSVRKALKEQEEQIIKQQKSIYLIYKFPGLKKAMVNLMSVAFPKFISDVKIISPKPTTFNIKLINGMDFYLIYLGKSNYQAKIAGKKYDLINQGENQRASQSISNILEFNYAPVDTSSDIIRPDTNFGDMEGETSFSGGEIDLDAEPDTSTPSEDDEIESEET